MLHGPEEVGDLWTAIKAEIRNGEERKVIIFVSTLEADSVCAVKLLQDLLGNEGLHYGIFPVATYQEVQDVFDKQINTDEELKNVFLINCGGTEDVVELLRTREGTRLIIIDSHRPFHHNTLNTQDSQAIILCDRDDIHPNNALPDPDGESGADEPDIDDTENQDGQEAAHAAKRRRSEECDKTLSKRERRKLRRKAVQQRRKDYYEIGTFWGRPATLILLKLAQSLRQDDSHFLWLAAVALTDQLVHERIAKERYAEYASELELEIQASSPDTGQDIRIQVEGRGGEPGFTTIKRPNMRVTAGKDLRFPLMRYWSLYDAMLHSTFVAVRLQTWADKGRRKLEELLAKMGFRLSDCKLDYSVMKRRIHQQLQSKLEEYGSLAQLSDVAFNSFHLQWGYRTPLAATDAVHAITALLESHATLPTEQGSASDAFWWAWEALKPPGSASWDRMSRGLELAKRLQRAILTDGGLIIARQDLRNHSKCYFVDLTMTEVTNKALLSQPMALLKLGMFLRDQRMWKQNHRHKESLLIIGPADADNRCLVVSVAKPPSIANIEGDQFTILFPMAAEAAGCMHASMHGFNSCVRQVSAESTGRLVKEMALLLQSRR